MSKSPYRPFHPNPEQLALRPEITGNAINGLGERRGRKAQPIYWHAPETLAHGEMQKWFYTQDPNNAAIEAARRDRAKILEIDVPAVSGEPIERSAEAWMAELRAFVTTVDMDLFGVAEIRPEWCFEGHQVPQRWAIMIGATA